jgi:hypothetical protein
MSNSTCLSKRDFLLLPCWVSTFLLYAPSYDQSIVVILSLMCMVPRFYWFIHDYAMTCLKLLVSSHPWTLKVSKFCFQYGQAEYYFVFLLCSRQSLYFSCTLYIFFRLILFMTPAWFQSSLQYYIYHVDVIMIPALCAFTIAWSWLCDSMSPQKLFLLSLTYSGRAGVNLGDVVTLQMYL